ncbi:MAG: GyrI-like domain-containing protein [candidate division WOR-3 bacterium]
MSHLLRLFVAVTAAAVIIGCGGPEAEKPKPPEPPPFTASVEKIGPMTAAVLAKIGPYSGAGEAWKALADWAQKNKVELAGPQLAFYYDDPAKVKPESTRYEICFGVAEKTKGDKTVKVRKLEAADVAVTTHVGPYDNVGATYAKLAEWIAANNLEVAGPSVEFLAMQEGVPAESLKTKVGFIVKPKAPPADTTAKPTGKTQEKKPERTGR